MERSRLSSTEIKKCEECQEAGSIEPYLLTYKSHETATNKLIRKILLIGGPANSLNILLGLRPQCHQQESDIIEATMKFVEEKRTLEQI